MTDSIYQRLRDQHVAAVLQLRFSPTERSGIERLLRAGVIERNSPSESIAPKQLALSLGQAAASFSPSPRLSGVGTTPPTIRQSDQLGDKI